MPRVDRRAIILSVCAIAGLLACRSVLDVEIPDEVAWVVVVSDDYGGTVEDVLAADDLFSRPSYQLENDILLGFDSELARNRPPQADSKPFVLREGETCALPVQNLIWFRAITPDGTIVVPENESAPRLCWKLRDS